MERAQCTVIFMATLSNEQHCSLNGAQELCSCKVCCHLCTVINAVGNSQTPVQLVERKSVKSDINQCSKILYQALIGNWAIQLLKDQMLISTYTWITNCHTVPAYICVRVTSFFY